MAGEVVRNPEEAVRNPEVVVRNLEGGMVTGMVEEVLEQVYLGGVNACVE
jgi:hypothetical protein